MVQSLGAMQWTNRSVVRFAEGEDDPVGLIERKARELVLRARDAGWEGPPFNPLAIAKLLNISAEANADVIDARTISNEKGLRIQFNPTQPRERLRFSIAHEIAHKNSTALILPNNGRIGLRRMHTRSTVVMLIGNSRIGMTKDRTGEVRCTASVER